jgi:radical SAM-linked protein
MVRERVRIRFRKQGELRLIGHRDLVRSMERLFRRAGLPLGMSQGYHPKPRMSFPTALAVGIEGLDEVMELELAETCTAEELNQRLARHTLPGLVFSSVQELPPGAKKAQIRSFCYQIPVPAPRRAATADRLTQVTAAASYPVPRVGKSTTVDLRSCLEELLLDDGLLKIRLANREGGAGPRDVLAALGLADLEQQGAYLTRTRVELE